MTTIASAWRTAVSFLYSCIVFPLQYMLLLIFSLIIIPLAYAGAERLVKIVLHILAHSTFIVGGKRVRISGVEHINPDKNYLLVANHASFYDVPAIMIFQPRIAWIGRSEFLNIPVFSTMLRLNNFIPVYRNDKERSRKAVDHAIEKASRLTIGIFPEGTRSAEGTVHPFKKGFVHILRGSELDLLPVTLNGFHDFKPRNRWRADPFATLEAVIHPPITRTELLRHNDNEIIEQVSAVIRAGLTTPSGGKK